MYLHIFKNLLRLINWDDQYLRKKLKDSLNNANILDIVNVLDQVSYSNINIGEVFFNFMEYFINKRVTFSYNVYNSHGDRSVERRDYSLLSNLPTVSKYVVGGYIENYVSLR